MIDNVAKFIFENFIRRFGCPRNLTSDQGRNLLNTTIATLSREFLI
jgi:hypothetical protein